MFGAIAMPRHSRSRSRERHRDRDRRRSRSPDEKEERRRRRAKMWDVDPSGNVAPPTGDGTAAVGAGAHAMAAMQQTAMMTAVLQQQAALTRRARRLHVGNLPPGLNTDAIRELFNTTMNAAKLTLDENPCVCDVHMSGDARFSFVEFRSVLECSNALVLDGMQLLGKALKVQRPNDYQAPPPGLDRVIIPQSISAVVTSSTVPNATAGILGMHGANIAAMGGNPAMAAALSAAGVGPTNSVSGLSGAALAAMSMGHGAGAGALASVGAATALGQNHMGLTRRCRRIHVGARGRGPRCRPPRGCASPAPQRRTSPLPSTPSSQYSRPPIAIPARPITTLHSPLHSRQPAPRCRSDFRDAQAVLQRGARLCQPARHQQGGRPGR